MSTITPHFTADDHAVAPSRTQAALKPILVTGTHRSGTTWVGRILCASPQLLYCDEPFNPIRPGGPGMCSARFEKWFTYVTPDMSETVRKQMMEMIRLRFNLGSALLDVRSITEMRRVAGDLRKTLTCKMRGGVPLFKDPIALFSASWLAETFNMNVLVLIRHPAAFVSSIARMKWRLNFNNFVEQPELLNGLLAPFAAEIREQARSEKDLIEHGILVWRLMHAVIADYQRQHPEWTFVRHEDLSRDPIAEFGPIFSRFGLDFSEQVQHTIRTLSNGDNPAESPGAEHFLTRDSVANIKNWKKRLKPEEIARVRSGCEDVSQQFYTDADW